MTGSAFVVGSTDPELYTMTDGIVRPDRNIPLEDAMRLAEADPIWALRGKAIQAYASLEQTLCMVFAAVGDIKPDTAGVVFFKISSTNSRNAILEKLIHKKCGNQYNAFWNSYFVALRPLDMKRNEIVHWNAITHTALNDKNVLLCGVSLEPPNFLGRTPSTPRLLCNDLVEFSAKCGVFARHCTGFSMVASGTMPSEHAQPWLDIFQRPFLYPLPEGHLLAQRGIAPDSQPQPSLE